MIDEPRAKTLTGILCTFDTLTKYRVTNYIGVHPAMISSRRETDGTSGKRDAEIKLLISCHEKDTKVIRDFLKGMNTLYVPNPMVDNDLSN